MKKILITALLAALTAGSSFAQGQVGFGNTASNAIFLNSGSTTTKMFGSAGTYDFGLYMGSAGTTSLSGMQLVALALSPNATTSTIFNAGLFFIHGWHCQQSGQRRQYA